MMRSRIKAWSLSALMIAAILWPIQENWQPQPKDDFPFSYFPMFSSRRAETYRVTYVVGYDSLDNRYQIPYKFAGSGGFNQVRRKLNAARSNGEGPKLLEKVAKTWEKRKAGPPLVRVDLVQGQYHLDRFFLENERSPISEEIIITYQPSTP